MGWTGGVRRVQPASNRNRLKAEKVVGSKVQPQKPDKA